jgi:hypothetical protein
VFSFYFSKFSLFVVVFWTHFENVIFHEIPADVAAAAAIEKQFQLGEVPQFFFFRICVLGIYLQFSKFCFREKNKTLWVIKVYE